MALKLKNSSLHHRFSNRILLGRMPLSILGQNNLSQRSSSSIWLPFGSWSHNYSLLFGIWSSKFYNIVIFSLFNVISRHDTWSTEREATLVHIGSLPTLAFSHRSFSICSSCPHLKQSLLLLQIPNCRLPHSEHLGSQSPSTCLFVWHVSLAFYCECACKIAINVVLRAIMKWLCGD